MLNPSLFEFQQWSLEQQMDYLTENGRYLSWKTEGEYNVYLYQVDDFFAEVWMNVKQSKVFKIDCSKNRSMPGGYEDQVNI